MKTKSKSPAAPKAAPYTPAQVLANLRAMQRMAEAGQLDKQWIARVCADIHERGIESK